MPEDATLDEFASGGGSDDADEPERSGDENGGSERSAGADPPGRDRVAPAVSTYRFAPDGRACDGCGGSVARLWRDGDALVCPDCKRWQE